MFFTTFDPDTAFLLRQVCREAFDILVLEGDPATCDSRAEATKDIIARRVLMAAETDERDPDQLCAMALRGISQAVEGAGRKARMIPVQRNGGNLSP